MGKRTVGRRATRVVLHLVIVVAVIVGSATPAFAAKPSGHGGGGGGGGGGTVTPTGNDVSYPQCGSNLPASPAFGIVGVTGGLANDLNPCFGPSSAYPAYTASELYWAVASTVGGTSQPKASLYVNTADPGNVSGSTVIADWPTSGSTPYGDCLTTTVTVNGGTYTVGANSDACAWQYGDNKAAQDVTWLAEAASAIDAQSPPVPVSGGAGSYPWWLDVETANTWQSDLTMNVAVIQGMIAGLEAAGATSVGAYSTSSQWDSITGGTNSASGTLFQIPNWIPGARDLSGAEANCAQASFTGGKVTVTQWFGHPDDGDYAC
ncbi:MAG: hypothetical protein ACYCV5_01980 [Acidimicrobiales bacterium]